MSATFAEQIRQFAEKADRRTNAVVKKIVIDVGTALVLKSPVGDADYWKSPAPPGYTGGRFRGNWQYGLNAPEQATTFDIDKSGAATINAIVGKVGEQAAGYVHYITNSLPYAKALEEGRSRQAPHGMVALTVAEFQPIVAAAVAGLQ